jgi:hypothetical protein
MDINDTAAMSALLSSVATHTNEWDGFHRWNSSGAEVLEDMYDPNAPAMVPEPARLLPQSLDQ